MRKTTAFSRCGALLVAGLGFGVIASAGDPTTTVDTARPERDVIAEWRALQSLSTETLPSKAQLLIQSLTAAELALVRAEVFGTPASPDNDAASTTVLARWGELEGPAAYAFAAQDTTFRRPDLETAALRGWAKHDPRAAWDRLMVISNRGADRRYGEEELLGVIAETNLPLALELFEDLTSDRSCLMCNASILVLHARRRGQLPLISDEIGRLPAGPAREALRDAYWNSLGKYSPAEALRLLGGASPGDAEAARVQLLVGWSLRDFSAALDYALANLREAALDRALLLMVQSWAHGAVAEDVGAVIRRLPANLSERSLLGLVRALARVDPKAATEWSATFANDAIRTECLSRAMWEWARVDAEAAHAYLRAQKDLGTRGWLLRSYVLTRVSNNTLRLGDLEGFTELNPDWVSDVLAELSLRLVDPSSNRTGSFDLKAYVNWVRANPQLNETQRARALGPIEQAPKKSDSPGTGTKASSETLSASASGT